MVRGTVAAKGRKLSPRDAPEDGVCPRVPRGGRTRRPRACDAAALWDVALLPRCFVLAKHSVRGHFWAERGGRRGPRVGLGKARSARSSLGGGVKRFPLRTRDAGRGTGGPGAFASARRRGPCPCGRRPLPVAAGERSALRSTACGCARRPSRPIPTPWLSVSGLEALARRPDLTRGLRVCRDAQRCARCATNAKLKRQNHGLRIRCSFPGG